MAAVQGSGLRRGLPRVAGGEPWPPAGTAVLAGTVAPVGTAVPVLEPAERDEAPTVAPVAPVVERHIDASASAQRLRRGLPRTPGGDPWPPEGVLTASSSTVTSHAPAPASPAADAPQAPAEQQPTAPAAAAPAQAAATATGTSALRRGLPRTPGGDPWPPAGLAAASTAPAIETQAAPETTTAAAVPVAAEAPVAASATIDVTTPLPFTRTVWPGTAPRRSTPPVEPVRIGPFTKAQWAGTVIVGGIALLGAAAMAVFFVRWFLSLDFMQDFLATYPGEYHLPEGAPVGFPGWLGWQHFFNVFLMVLIIRSGLRVRNEKRPTAFWTPRNKPKGKVSLTIWFHQSLDILWLINGVVFIVLLFVTGQWMRVIPTSWEVIPNAVSAVLQYISLDWPTENGWVNYNSIQQIAYFTTIFLAAPLAAITGFRMSGMWPKKAERLSRAYPIEWARKVHFPVMLYFVAFIAVHVFLVFATGALRNLNHMYAVQGSVDPAAYADNWTGFWFFAASLVVIAAAWAAARPLVLAPIAKLFGTVSGR